MIHDNGGRPFKVDISSKVDVYKQISNDVYESTPFLTLQPQRIFVGTSPLIPMTEFSDGYGPEFDGNSILLEMDPKEKTYIFIGSEIFSFQSFDKIVKFVSPVGNNDVPYPYAIDECGNCYLLLEDVVLKLGSFTIQEPYQYYYKQSRMTTDVGFFPPKQPELKFFNDIRYFMIGNSATTLSYHPFPGDEYDRL